MSAVSWEETTRRMRERREAAGLQVRSPEEKQAAMDRLTAEIRAYRLAEIRREHPNAVRYGILLRGMAGTDDDADILTRLGAFWAFSREACEALAHSQTDPARALFAIGQGGGRLGPCRRGPWT